MPFKSEKQRRFLWAEHPEIAKRWADKYPESNKGLPMYANDKDDKTDSKSTKNAIYGAVVENRHKQIRSILSDEPDQNLKVADSKQEKVDMPQSEKPVYAGEEREKGMISGGINTSAENNESCGENAINTLLQKLSVVLSPHIEQTMENMNAENEGRVPRRVGRNAGLKQYPVATPQIPLPMGMQQPQAQPQQTQQAKQTQPASPTPVGAGQSSATTDPIKFHSGLSASGIINGNAALSAPNTVNTKISALVEKWAEIGLWDRIRAKKKRGEKPAKPGDKDYPDSKSWNKVTAISEKSSMAGNEILSQLMGMNSVSECDIADLLELEADERTPTKLAEMLTKWAGTPAWQRAAGKNDEGGLNAKGRASYNRATGGNLKAPVTEKNPSGSRAKRQNSFCSRMCGMKSKETGAKTKADPDSRINKALRKWNCKCGSEKTAAESWPYTSRALSQYIPELVTQTLPLHTALGTLAGAGYGGVTGKGVVRNALRGGLIGTGAGIGNAAGGDLAWGLNADINDPHDAVLNNNSQLFGSTAGTLGGALGGNQLYNVLERMYDKHREKKKKPEKQAQEFDPALSRDAENAIMHGTGLVGSGVLGSVAGIPVSAGLESLAQRNNMIPDSEKSPWMHLLAQGLIRTPIIAGGMLGTRLYDNYILRPHMRRELQRKQEEDAIRQQLAMKKQADASLQRILGTALASTGGGLLLGSYPGWKLQRASEAAGNSDFTNFVAGKAPIALAGALSAGAYNHWLDQYEKKPKHKKKEPPAHPSLKYVQYLVH